MLNLLSLNFSRYSELFSGWIAYKKALKSIKLLKEQSKNSRAGSQFIGMSLVTWTSEISKVCN